MISDLFSMTVLVGILASGIRLATPYLYAAIGETFSQRSGVLNLGVDGQMLLGAFAAFYVAIKTGNLWLGMLAAMIVGALMGLAMAFVTVNLNAEQGISGIGFYLFGLGLSDLLFQKLLGTVETVKGFRKVNIPVLSDLPVVGEIFFRQNILVYIAFALVPIAWFVLNKTTLGLKIRAVGENPEAADSLGVSIARVRYFTVILGGTLSGVAGASMSIALLNVFQQNMTSSLGFIAVALVYFGAWRPWGSVGRSLAFQFSELPAALDPGPGYPYSIGYCGYDAIHHYDFGSGSYCVTRSSAFRARQTFRESRLNPIKGGDIGKPVIV